MASEKIVKIQAMGLQRGIDIERERERESALRIMKRNVKEKGNPQLKDDGEPKYNVDIF